MLAIPEHASWQEKHCPQQCKHCLERDANEPEGKGEKPKERPEDKCQQCQGPAED
jgi:hypothetical protein